MKFNIIFSILLIVVFTTSCRYLQTPGKKLDCKLPQQTCLPLQFNGIVTDTSEAYLQTHDSSYAFEPLKQTNTVDDEWALCFISPQKAILTINDNNMQRVMMAKMLNYKTLQVESGIGIGIEGSIGAASIAGNQIIFAAKENKVILNDPDAEPLNKNSVDSINLKEGSFATTDIYTGEIQGNLVKKIKKLDSKINRTKFSWESQPTQSSDGTVVFFASDRGDKTKGIDIWFSVKLNDGLWSEAINCGENINSSCDELTPFMTNDGKQLLFASSGFENAGGYDIFVSRIKTEFWKDVSEANIQKLQTSKNYFSRAENLGKPLNTSADELFPSTFCDPDSLLYYSSNQSPKMQSMLFRKGGFDLYVRHKIYSKKSIVAKIDDKNVKQEIKEENPEQAKENETPELNTKMVTPVQLPVVSPVFTLQGKVQKHTTFEPIAGADISIKSTFNADDTVPLDTSFKSEADGDYKIDLYKGNQYEIIAQTPDLFFDSYKIYVDKSDTVSILEIDFQIPEQMTLRINFPNNVYDEPYKYVLDSNGVETNRTWQEEIDLLVANILKYKDKIEKIQLTGHTDDVGSDKSNYTLGKNRVNFVILQIVNRGVPKEMLEGFSKGENSPLERKQDEDLELFRKRLRRVDLQKIIVK